MQEKLEQHSFLLLLGLVSILFFYLLKPFFGAILWAYTIAMLFYPLHLRLLQRCRDHTNLTTLCCCQLSVVSCCSV